MIFRTPRFFSTQLILILAIGLTSCASFIGTANTPTPTLPTLTPVPPTATPPPSAAIVNGEFITLVEFEAELARYKSAQTALGLTFTETDASKVVLEDMIAQVLLAQGASRENFVLTEADLQSRIDALAAEIGGAGALSQWQSAHSYDEVTFRSAMRRAIESAWMRDKIAGDVPTVMEQIHIRQILTYNQADADYALTQLNGGADFDELAALYDPLTRGELGWAPKGYLLDPAADEAVFALQVGSYSQVVSTPAGFHIFKALEREQRPLSPDALLAMQEIAVKEWIASERAKSEIILAP